MATIPTRISEDVSTAAAAVARDEHRSTSEQINYWVRVGMQVERSTTATSRMTLAVVTGRAPFSTLPPQQRAIAHSLIDADLSRRVAAAQFGQDAHDDGKTAVYLDDDGRVVQMAPGSERQRS
ncbi:MAG: hypothetical protein JST73_03800 [Actinobacteria bacterium]|nr:hypothetical protein [Actinomycetota bacterium]